MKFKHSKYKNTALLFELLTIQIASDTMNNKLSEALRILKRHFKKGTELHTELSLYKALSKNTLKTRENAFRLIESVLEKRRKINRKKLAEQKYKLNKDIKNIYGDEFYKTRVNSYRTYAHIHNLFEYTEADNPLQYAVVRENLIENLLQKKSAEDKRTSLRENSILDKDDELRLITYKILVDKFNKKYEVLTSGQKEILKEYINSISNSPQLKEFVDKKALQLKRRLLKAQKNLKDNVLKIKLRELSNLLEEKIVNFPTVKDDNILSLLQYEELLKELKG